jgi:hypothetical protein
MEPYKPLNKRGIVRWIDKTKGEVYCREDKTTYYFLWTAKRGDVSKGDLVQFRYDQVTKLIDKLVRM